MAALGASSPVMLFPADSLHELELDPLAVEVAFEVEQVDLDDGLGDDRRPVPATARWLPVRSRGSGGRADGGGTM